MALSISYYREEERWFWLEERDKKRGTKWHFLKWVLGNTGPGSQMRRHGRWGRAHEFKGTGLCMACFDHTTFMSSL